MLRRFQGLLMQVDEEKDVQFPTEDPLIWLLKEAEGDCDSQTQKRLDQDPGRMSRLIQECPDARMSWEELRVIRRYTINFNPAIELEAGAGPWPGRPADAQET